MKKRLHNAIYLLSNVFTISINTSREIFYALSVKDKLYFSNTLLIVSKS